MALDIHVSLLDSSVHARYRRRAMTIRLTGRSGHGRPVRGQALPRAGPATAENATHWGPLPAAFPSPRHWGDGSIRIGVKPARFRSVLTIRTWPLGSPARCSFGVLPGAT